MNKNRLRAITDIGLYFSFLFLIATGLLMQYRLVPGSKGGSGLTLFGMGRHDWGEWHFYMALAILILVAIHLILNAHFVWKIISSGRIYLLLLLAAAGTAIVALLLFSPLERRSSDVDDHHSVEETSRADHQH